MRILLVGPNWIGDAVMSIPAMRMVRAAFPGAFVALQTRSWAEGVFQDADFLDELVTFDNSRFKLGAVIRQARKLRTFSFDFALLFPNSFQSAFTIAAARIPRRFGYSTDGRALLLTDSYSVPAWKRERHESEYYANLVEQAIPSLGGVYSKEQSNSSLAVSDERKANAKDLLILMNFDPTRPLIAIGAGSTNSVAKRWPTDYFCRLCDLFEDDISPQIVLLGSKAESQIADRLKRNTRANVIDLTGNTDLSMATSILASADIFVSNDMGLAHISAAVGTPTLTLFGPTNETATAPLGPNARYIREVVECSPCMLRECPIDHRCMIRLTPERVFETAVAMLKG